MSFENSIIIVSLPWKIYRTPGTQRNTHALFRVKSRGREQKRKHFSNYNFRLKIYQ